MRIAILTQPLRYNYGGILQNFALQTVLRRMGHDVVTLDPPRYFYPKWKYPIVFLRHAAARYIKGHSEVPIFAEYLLDRETKILGTNTFSFVDTYIQREEYRNLSKEIQEGDFDAFVVGSDQTWRCRYNRNRIYDMFLFFTKDWNIKRIAYAASFGTDEWEGDAAMTKICSDSIKDFDLVTVRESSGIDICRKVFNVDACQVLDPTLLLKKEEYMNLVNRNENINTQKGDFYLYILDENEENKQLSKEIAESKGLNTYTCHSMAIDLKQAYIINERIKPPIELWLKGFDQAKVILTDSFHACVFSIIFRKQFYLYANKVRGLERYISLFNMLGINNRTVKSFEDVKDLQDINYEIVYDRLRYLQHKSLNLIKDFLMRESR